MLPAKLCHFNFGKDTFDSKSGWAWLFDSALLADSLRELHSFTTPPADMLTHR